MTLSPISSISRAPRRVFYLTGNRLTVYHWRARRLAEAVLFQAGEEGLADFSAYLQEMPGISSYFLIDIVEEEYRRDTVPHVFARDRRELLANRSRRLFRQTPYWHAILQGRQTEGRRDDRVLYAAVTNPGLLNPWLERIRQLKAPLHGIYSVPLLTPALLPYLGAADGPNLVVSLQSAGHLRQTFFHGKDLKLSRLAHLSVRDPREIASAVIDEAEKLRRYLNSLRLLERDRPLNAYVLSHGALLDELGQATHDLATTRFHPVNIGDLANRLRMAPSFVSPYADALFAQLLLLNPPQNQYATPQDTLYCSLSQARTAMLAASVAVLLGGVLWGALETVNGFVYEQRRVATRQQTDYYRQRYSQARESLPKAPADASDMRAVVAAADALSRAKATPREALVALSEGLERYPNVSVDRAQWRIGTSPTALLGLSSPPPGLEQAPAEAVYQVLRIDAHLAGYDGDYRRTLDAIKGFAESLRQVPGVRYVQITRLPVNLSPDRALAGTVRDQAPARDNASVAFSFRLLFRREDATA